MTERRCALTTLQKVLMKLVPDFDPHWSRSKTGKCVYIYNERMKAFNAVVIAIEWLLFIF
jgi:hypothetical protein